MMTYTKFGNCVRKLRIRNRELLIDMANLLGVSASTLSAAEHGRIEVPNDWPMKIIHHYNLTYKEYKLLMEINHKENR